MAQGSGKRPPGRPRHAAQAASEHVKVRFTPDLRRAAQQAADAAGLSLASWIRRQVERGVREAEGQDNGSEVLDG